MNRREFLFSGLRGALLGAAIVTGFASTKLSGGVKADDITRARKAFEQAYREELIGAFDKKPLVLRFGGGWDHGRA